MKTRNISHYQRSLTHKLRTETGALHRPAAPKLRMALVFPNEYRVGMSSLGFDWVAQVAVQVDGVLCERVFLPEHEHLKELLRTGEQILSLESQSQLATFDIVAFSLQYEMDYANVVRILQLAKIPARSADRDSAHPLILAGGPCATFNPEPMAEFVDMFVVGDAEPVLPELLRLLIDTDALPRQQRLREISALDSVYVPSFPKKVKRALYAGTVGAVSSILTPKSEFGKTNLVEISRGCGRRCRFCVAGHIGRPVRYMQLDSYPVDGRIGLVGAAVLDHPEVRKYCRQISTNSGTYTMSSIRMETLDEDTCRMLADSGTHTVTIAPEAGSERLRRVLNKEISTLQILGIVQNICNAGIRKLRLYFMLGLPTETRRDVQDIVDLVREISRTCPHLKIGVSASCFVPKPFTPFQWHPMEFPHTLKTRFSHVKNGLSEMKNVEFGGESPRLAHVQALLARGDRKLADMIEIAARDGDAYVAAIRKASVDLEQYIYRQIDFEEELAWDFIDTGVTKTHLRKEYQLALAQIASGYCDIDNCNACGACD